MPLSSPPCAADMDALLLPVALREVFISTLRADIQRIEIALDTGNTLHAAQCFHSVAGALGVVNALPLARACVELENQLREQRPGSGLELQARQLAQRLTLFLDQLEQ
ncbi:Hpt domain-containing protein [Pseudomonas sp. TH05]|uniref:Hpt domain-containing protein n=1 Tax=unclassified Pseudomonas TaxID=196821 RepID=UPI000997B03A|nr:MULTISPECIES: Hpt domain-containing protein [unclassified Pseudomonas]MBK5541258.1 Hpt domain-containing protein [Pseudomonas sp. TH07]MBK5557999.1 Hpt domain-containing protein [Pseudomonas sp. TH05]